MNFALEIITQKVFDHSRKIAAATSIVLIILMSLTVANSVLTVLEAANPPKAPFGVRQPDPLKERQFYKVSDLELFGKATNALNVQQVLDAPETKLNLELQGVFIAENKERSTAIVGEANKSGELFKIGDRLPGNVKLSAVFVDHILLRRGSRTEKLRFDDSKYRIKKTETVKNIGSGISSKDRPNLEDNRGEIHSSAASPLPPPGRSDTTNYREKFKSDPVAFLSEAGIRPVKKGETMGYRIDADAQSQVRRIGLQPGDVVLSVNGRPIGAKTNDSAVIDRVMSSSRVRVEVQRGERRFFLTIPVPK